MFENYSMKKIQEMQATIAQLRLIVQMKSFSRPQFMNRNLKSFIDASARQKKMFPVEIIDVNRNFARSAFDVFIVTKVCF